MINAVKRVAGKPFDVKMSSARPGDPPAIVAASDKIRATLGWKPTLDNLDLIVSHALAWEEHLGRRNLVA